MTDGLELGRIATRVANLRGSVEDLRDVDRCKDRIRAWVRADALCLRVVNDLREESGHATLGDRQVLHHVGDTPGLRRRLHPGLLLGNGEQDLTEVVALLGEIIEQFVNSRHQARAKSTAARACSAVVSKTGMVVSD